MIDAAYVWLIPFASTTLFSIWFDPSQSDRTSSLTRRLWHDEAMQQSLADDIFRLSTTCGFFSRRVFVSVRLPCFT